MKKKKTYPSPQGASAGILADPEVREISEGEIRRREVLEAISTLFDRVRVGTAAGRKEDEQRDIVTDPFVGVLGGDEDRVGVAPISSEGSSGISIDYVRRGLGFGSIRITCDLRTGAWSMDDEGIGEEEAQGIILDALPRILRLIGRGRGIH